MNPESSEGLRKELLDDFYAECDELLTGIRSNITALERGVPDKAAELAKLEELFRGVHSVKGNCAIAGLRPAEELAHVIEDLLRALNRHEVTATPPMLDLMLVATDRLNKIVDAHRKQKSLPKISDLVPRIAAYLPGKNPAGQAAEPQSLPETPAATDDDPIAAARAQGLEIWSARFVPSAALEAKGVRINTIRERLAQRGTILKSAPVIVPGKGLSFEFTLALKQTPADAAAWAKDGVTFERSTLAPAPARAAEEATETADDYSSLSLTPSHVVRVDLGHLDELMRITGEIIIQRSRLEDRLGHQQKVDSELKDIDLALARSLRQLRAAVSRVRLVPVEEVFARMPYVVRDLARDSAKQARVLLEGQQTEIDKFLVERLKEPLLHLVRNAFAHGVETAEQRARVGKPAEATIRLRANRVGDAVEIQVQDDGRGINAQDVAARATKLGLFVPPAMDEAALLKILCEPGFSTQSDADRAAGRGVGMAVVWNTVRELGGSLRLTTQPGQGTAFILRLPLTLSIADALIVNVGNQTCAIPQAHVEEIFQAPDADVRTIQTTEIVPYRRGLLPIVRLRAVFGIDGTYSGPLTIVVISSDRGVTGLVVDRVQTRREIVIRALTDPLVQVPAVSGATELGNGRPILILDPAMITAGVVRPPLDETDAIEEKTQLVP